MIKFWFLNFVFLFHEIIIQINKDSDPIAGRDPFFLKGKEWKETRNEISPAFSNSRVCLYCKIYITKSNDMIKITFFRLNHFFP